MAHVTRIAESGPFSVCRSVGSEVGPAIALYVWDLDWKWGALLHFYIHAGRKVFLTGSQEIYLHSGDFRSHSRCSLGSPPGSPESPCEGMREPRRLSGSGGARRRSCGRSGLLRRGAALVCLEPLGKLCECCHYLVCRPPGIPQRRSGYRCRMDATRVPVLKVAQGSSPGRCSAHSRRA